MRALILALMIWCTPSMFTMAAFAQQPESAQVRALNFRIGAEINSNIQCTTTALTLQDQLAVAQAEVKRLSDKYEPKKDEPAKP